MTTRSSPTTSSIPRASLAPPVPPASTTTGPALIAIVSLWVPSPNTMSPPCGFVSSSSPSAPPRCWCPRRSRPRPKHAPPQPAAAGRVRVGNAVGPEHRVQGADDDAVLAVALRRKGRSLCLLIERATGGVTGLLCVIRPAQGRPEPRLVYQPYRGGRPQRAESWRLRCGAPGSAGWSRRSCRPPSGRLPARSAGRSRTRSRAPKCTPAGAQTRVGCEALYPGRGKLARCTRRSPSAACRAARRS